MQRFLYFLMCVALSVSVNAQNQKFSSSTTHWLRYESDAKHLSSPYGAKKHAFVAVTDKDELDKLQKMGVTVNAKFSDFATVSLTQSQARALCEENEVKYIDLGGKLKLYTDSVRGQHTHTGWVQEGQGLPQGYDGTGVIVGMIDVGFDYRHLAFRNADGSSRITRVYHPNKSGASPVVVGGDTLPGCEYTTAEEIVKLTYDTKNTSHGTHTAGIAAGTYVGVYGGMAPGAELVLCGLDDDITETGVVNAAYYIAHYAKQQGKPCVINISMGNQDGPHDGMGFMSRAFDQLSRDYGVVFVLSSGNEGIDCMYVHHSFTEDKPTVATAITQKEFEIDAWSSNSDSLLVQLSFVNMTTRETEYTTTVLRNDTTLSAALQEGLAAYIGGQLDVTFGQNPYSQKRYINLAYQVNASTAPRYWIAMKFYGKVGQELNVWEGLGNASFFAPDERYVGASYGCSISDMATGKETISVGAYVDRAKYTNLSGATTTFPYSQIGAIATYSSYGIDMNGVKHPFVMAPGSYVISAYSSAKPYSSSYAQMKETPEGMNCYWSSMSGTSMAAPCVTGIVALWLQANPALTVNDIKKIIEETAYHDKFTDASSERFGANGKIDAYAGMKLALQSSLKGDVNGDGEVNPADVSALVNVLLGEGLSAAADVNGDGDVTSSDVSALVNILMAI